ncbi:hypothetical protein [Selenomonas sp. AE3005]|uniref:hypothetical protein n=1 Tax=Selenomonas sp. AE3005 TaxID=1485543 RepID=UPI000486851F|nr:hypothetical protein [Selenomonas sp. AE3005]
MFNDTESAIRNLEELTVKVSDKLTYAELEEQYKFIKKAKAELRQRHREIREKRKNAKADTAYRKHRTHQLIMLGAEYVKVFGDFDIEKATARFKLIKQSELLEKQGVEKDV